MESGDENPCNQWSFVNLRLYEQEEADDRRHNAILTHERHGKLGANRPLGPLRDPILLCFFKNLQGFHKVRTTRFIYLL